VTPAGVDAREELLALIAAGAMSEGATVADCADAWLDYAAVAECLADTPPVAPPVELKSRLLARLDPPPGYTITRADDTTFRPTPEPGLEMRILSVDHAARRFSCLLKFAPGARLPAHPHASAEECVVLEGNLYMGGVHMTAGDFLRVEEGVDHVEQWSDTGALAFVSGPLELLEH
jgi:hypothetical protein